MKHAWTKLVAIATLVAALTLTLTTISSRLTHQSTREIPGALVLTSMAMSSGSTRRSFPRQVARSVLGSLFQLRP